LLLALIFCLFEARHRQLKLKRSETSLPVMILYGVIFIGIYFHSVFLFYLKDGQYWIQDLSNLGDLSFHWGTIRYLAKGAHFWPENPIYIGHRFRYPFGMDFFNSLFENLGFPITAHLPLVTFFCLILTLYTLDVVGGPLLVFAVFFSAGFYAFWNESNWDLYKIQEHIDFKNLFLTVLVTQRGFLYALPAGLYIFQAFKSYFAKEWKPNLFEKISLGVIWGGLGFFHLHSYFILSLYFGLWILWKKDLKTWLWTLLVAIVVGMPFVINALIPEPGTNPLIHFSRGWARPEDVNYVLYWLKNMGPWLVAVIGALIYFFRERRWQDFAPTALAFILFAIFAHLILAPWDWDNIKLIAWCYILALLCIQDWLWNDRSAVTKTVVFVVFFVPGLLIFVHSLPMYTHGTTWASERELNKATVLMKGQDVNQGLLVAPDYDHPALLLGYKLYMGYTGHVWSHGYNYGERENYLNLFFGGDATALNPIAKDQVHLIYQGPLEKRREKDATAFKDLPKIGEALDHELYRLEVK